MHLFEVEIFCNFIKPCWLTSFLLQPTILHLLKLFAILVYLFTKETTESVKSLRYEKYESL